MIRTLRWRVSKRLQFSLALLTCIPLACTGGDGDGNGSTDPPAAGRISVSTQTSGPDPDPDGYVVTIDDSAPTAIGAAATG